MAIEVTATGSGRQCLVQDLVQRHAWSIAEGFNERGSPARIVTFYRATHVDLDLQGHLVSSEPFENATGVALDQATSEASLSHLDDFPQHMSVRNGVIKTPGSRGVGIYLGFHKNFDLSTRAYASAYEVMPEDQQPLGDQRPYEPGKKIGFIHPWNYQPETYYSVDNMKVVSGGRGVIMVGANSVLRNSTIEVDGDTAVYLYGPNTLVEGNTFIVHLNPGNASELPAALKLRDADGAIIRNNRFMVKNSSGQEATAAINLLQSKDVLIENNVMENTHQLVRKDAESTAIERSHEPGAGAGNLSRPAGMPPP
ncbi:right-handed parallel beta-helix repeat-containing protein [Dyella subtropica]|uniref:right-handed parallel beta-helix repeat-containing protein n=1 Tax=Dyella subtropica TaxID=2992127 RepID=UPI002252FE5F|nr:right-handed parallel beta-helix repeat-containing protein [Dyella subtropica]